MDIPTKFRGKDMKKDEYVYGIIVEKGINCSWLLNAERHCWIKVKAGSVQKLAGYDEKGNEIYKSGKWETRWED